jgi:hypothetical protein
MAIISFYIFSSILLLGALISYTPIGKWVFFYLFGVNDELLGPMVDVYRVLMFVSIFSGVRCLFQGVIIFNMRTKWLTIGMAVRLLVMYLVSLYFIKTNGVTSGQVGAIIFLSGMIIEAGVSFWEGRLLLKKIPEKLEDHPIERPKQILGFYKPLLYSSIIAVIIGPAINSFMGKTSDFHLSVASLAIAASLTQLVQSFFSYIHQIVLNFYNKDASAVIRFTVILSLIPGLLLALLCFSPLGLWFMGNVMGVNERLMAASLDALKVFLIMAFVFPWLDFGNGLIMLLGDTRAMIWSQSANVVITLTTLVLCIALSPGWNGAIGAFAQSLGMVAEAAVIWLILRAIKKSGDRSPFHMNLNSRNE